MSANGGGLVIPVPGFDLSNGGGDELSARIHEALEIVHNPYSRNDARKTAQSFLEDVRDLSEAPFQGYKLASDSSQPPVVRHYALSLLEYGIRYHWTAYNAAQSTAVRDWVLLLAQGVRKDDPLYLRNKTAQMWVELAKACWGAEWMNMDSSLVELWRTSDSTAHKEFVLFVLETLSDEVFTGDDSVVALREGVLSRACVEIFTPIAVLTEAFPSRQPGPNVRCDAEGWLGRVSEFLSFCITSDANNSAEAKGCAVKALSVFLSLMPWAIPKAIAAARCVDVMMAGLSSSHTDIQKVQPPKLCS